MRVTRLALTSLLGVLALGSVNGARAADSKKLPPEIVIGWSPPDVTGVFATATEFFEKAAADARKHGINVKIVTQSPASHTDFGDQVSILEDFIARKVSCIVVSPTEVDVVIPALKDANNAGIPVIVVNLLEPIAGVKVASYVGFDNAEAGEISGYALLDYLGGPGVLGKGKTIANPPPFLDLAFWRSLYKDVKPESLNLNANVATIEGVAGGFFSAERLKGFHRAIDRFSGVKVVQNLPADWNRQKGVKAAEDILQANKKLDAIWAASNEMGMGAMSAVEAAHRQNEIGIVTNDGTPESVGLIKEGRLVAETWHGFPEWGWYGTRFAVAAALGLEVPPKYDIRPRIEYKKNANDFYPNVKLEPIPWDEMKRQALAK
jgi:ribose transport system substrate-binding protein